ncbi:YifB family Mg chelatase-like AAA ATPase [Cellulomonas shaoxiangyii]|uniref:ATP-binding protein n=1 Tax=Cellulomonas shaoxiangyii TaxID=2566013 RepID=A0A4P7SLB6_9CELL|nr:YifB family Mg chelatase-like AAA ATPase [Cellulomonas shaoxiangyii]QCB93976.1 ATP-binding protein [Cellulomonas shaoxiangyii]TGY81766.1 ATP-binding protein [Cellulomonas shaoxiangyii]
MLGRTCAVALVGLHGHVVEVEAHLATSLPAFSLVGLPDASLAESRDRVRAAVTSSGLAWPNRRITVNLSPATLPKTGSGFDLAVAVATLAGAGVVDATSVAAWVHVGELGLDGRVRPVRGVLPAVAAAVAAGRPRVVVPAGNAAEARLVPGAEVLAAEHLAQVAARHGADVVVPEVEPVPDVPPRRGAVEVLDLADVRGQEDARLGVEVAAAGGHHLLLVGPPGTGKTMLAARLPGLLPDLGEADAVEVTAVHSVAGTFDPAHGLLRRPPFEDPHHTATAASVVGGGSGLPRPGAASRAHRGVLFLDEAPEFTTGVLQTLRQPLEHGELVLHRAGGTARYPARFQLVLAANPCPCGRAVGKGLDCTCRPEQRRRYFGKLSGPLLDRVDLQLEVPPSRSADAPGEGSAAVAARVRDARETQRERWRAGGWRTNGEVPARALHAALGADARLLADLHRAVDRGTLTLRGADRVLRVAWTLADLDGRAAPARPDVARALALRTRGHGA